MTAPKPSTLPLGMPRCACGHGWDSHGGANTRCAECLDCEAYRAAHAAPPTPVPAECNAGLHVNCGHCTHGMPLTGPCEKCGPGDNTFIREPAAPLPQPEEGEGEKRMSELRIFTLVRVSDESGVSGTGRVLDGVHFHTGQVVICWRTDIDAAKHGHSSLGIYPSWEAFEFIHIKSHPTNETRIDWSLTSTKLQLDPCSCGSLSCDTCMAEWF